MNFYYDPDEWETVSESHICSYHRVNPGLVFSGCCCSASWGQKRRNPEEVAEIKAKKLKAHEDAVLLEAEFIKIRRKALLDGKDPKDHC